MASDYSERSAPSNDWANLPANAGHSACGCASASGLESKEASAELVKPCGKRMMSNDRFGDAQFEVFPVARMLTAFWPSG